MFSFLYHRNTVQGVPSTKRKNVISDDGEEENTIEQPKEKFIKLDLFEEEDTVSLPEDLAKQVNSYIRKHVSDKTLKDKILDINPVPQNVDRPLKLDMFIKDVITNYKSITLARDSQLLNVQTSIHKIFGPLTALWEAVENEKTSLPDDTCKEVLERMEEMSSIFQQTVALVGQASNRVSYYRRLNVVENITGDSKRAKELLGEHEDVFNEASTHLFGDKFEELICKLSKSKKKS